MPKLSARPPQQTIQKFSQIENRIHTAQTKLHETTTLTRDKQSHASDLNRVEIGFEFN